MVEETVFLGNVEIWALDYSMEKEDQTRQGVNDRLMEDQAIGEGAELATSGYHDNDDCAVTKQSQTDDD